MGEIKKQGISNSIIIMIGAVIGAFNVMFLFPKILPEEYFGLTRVLVEVTYIFLQFGILGGHSAIVRFWSIVTSKKSLIIYILKYSILFSIIILAFITIFKQNIVEFYSDKSPLIGTHFNSIYILFIFGLLFEIFSSISVGMLKTILPTFLKEVFIRIYVLSIIFLYYLNYINEATFIHLFVFGYTTISLIIIGFVIKNKREIKEEGKLIKNKKIEITKYRTASFFSGLSSGIVNRLDIIMIASLIASSSSPNEGLKAVAIYSIALYTATIIEIPSRGVFSISSPIISKLWDNKNLKDINSIYKKSSINLFAISLLLFLLLSLNIDNLLTFLKDSFLPAKPIILLLGISKVFNMLLGVNNIILSTSKYYIIVTYTMLGLIIITFLLNYWLIPIYGINGAAVGSLVSLVIYNLVSYMFLWYKYKIQPFSKNTIKIIVIAVIAYTATMFLIINNIYLSIIIKSIIFSIIYVTPIYLLNISEDINSIINKILNKT